ncbi:MAG: cytochrome c [Candidatus Dadabacteria bacterium]|nr:MAG: cytochrome c [Candidatus Dadabacteria bacterium]
MALGTLIAIDLMMRHIPPLPGSAHREDAPNKRVLEVASVDWAAAAGAGGAPVDLNTPLPEGNPANGPDIFVAQGCTACHTTSKVPGATGTVGPNLDGLGARAGSRVPGMDAKTYIRQSVEDPGAFVVEGYMKVMPSLRSKMSDQEFADLLAFLEGL